MENVGCLDASGCPDHSVSRALVLLIHVKRRLVLSRALSWDHPDRPKLAGRPELQEPINLSILRSLNQEKDLQYGDLHGVPCLLILCEKGRMGDTFPQTFQCLDLRIRTSENATTFIQELGRLCRYPTLQADSQSIHGTSLLKSVDNGNVLPPEQLACWQSNTFRDVVTREDCKFAGTTEST